jgi:Family of unknown function (DUF6625)
MPHTPTVLLILPYFGTFPRYSDLFFKSCEANPTINWLLVTDQSVDAGRLPPNVALRRTTFARLKKSIDAALGFETALESPYKLCDFKPAYGVIFADAIERFDFWGHCDMDLVFGDIRRFLTADILRAYSKVLIHGHLSLYRNSDDVNRYFTLEAPNASFREAFSDPRSFAFDEFGGMQAIYEHHGIRVFRNDAFFADIRHQIYRLYTESPPNARHQCFYWERGKLFRSFWENGTCGRQEYIYIHLQKRRMHPPTFDVKAADAWFIRPYDFVVKTSDPSTRAQMYWMNPRDVVHDSKRYLFAAIDRIKNTASRMGGRSP